MFFKFILLVHIYFSQAVLCNAHGVYKDFCQTPQGQLGHCISIERCPSLHHRTRRDRKQYRCPNKASSYCCQVRPAPECYTPDGYEGVCLSYTENQEKFSSYPVNFVLDSRCWSSGKICYSPTIRDFPNADTQCEPTAFPPDSRTHCCGKDATTEGHNDGLDEMYKYPWLALIKYRDPPSISSCSGSLVSALYVVTAAHCVDDSNSSPYAVVLGDYKTSSSRDCIVRKGRKFCADPPVTIDIDSIMIHPKYNPSLKSKSNDIAVIQLATMAPYSKFIRPICLPIGYDITLKPPRNLSLCAAGWGTMNHNVFDPGVKFHVELPFVDRETCSNIYKTMCNFKKIGKYQMCAGGEEGKDTCYGHSGGPLMYRSDKSQLLGVISFGHENCGTASIPGVYTKVYDYVPWIRSIMQYTSS